MHSAPAKFSLSKIESFFAPVVVKRYEGLRAKKKSSLRKIGFFSRADMESVLQTMQWKYIGGYCIRLSKVEEDPSLDGGKHWNIIHGGLQHDILSYFNVFDRSYYRRVCKEWDGILKHHWDAEVNRCLYLDFAFRDDNRLLVQWVEKAFRIISESSDGQCSRIPRLVLEYQRPTRLCHTEKKLDHADRPDGPSLLEEYLVRHSHFTTVMIIGIGFDDVEYAGNLLKFAGTVRWPRELRVIFHQCSFAMTHYFPPQVNQYYNCEPVPYEPGAGFIPHLFGYEYYVDVQNLEVKFGPEVNEEERCKRLHAELDKRKTFWPFPAEQLEWLKSLLANCPLEEHADEADSYSLRQTIRWYLKEEPIRGIVDVKWAPTGVFFESMELSWRDCLLLALLTTKWGLLGTTTAPCDMKDFAISFEFLAHWKQLTETEAQIAEFERQVACIEKDEPGHCVFFPIGPSNFKPPQDEKLEIQE